MNLPYTIITLSILLTLYIFLSARVIINRRNLHINLGDGANPQFQRMIRAHGNFAEYTPFLIICLCLLELQEYSPNLLCLCSGLMILSRYSHAYALSSGSPKPIFRVLGMVLTFSTFILFITLTLYSHFK